MHQTGHVCGSLGGTRLDKAFLDAVTPAAVAPQLLVGGAETTERVVLEFGELAVALEELAEPASRLAGFAGDRLGHGRSHGRSRCAYAWVADASSA